MHEQSLIRALLRQVDQLMYQHRATAVETVTVEVGPLSGVEVLLLQSAWRQLVTGGIFESTELDIQETRLLLKCLMCGCESSFETLCFKCHHCGSTQVQILQGDSFRLLDVTLKVPEPVQPLPAKCRIG